MKEIIGRLNSAEKLLSSHQGQMFAGSEFERLLSSIYELKKQVAELEAYRRLNKVASLLEENIRKRKREKEQARLQTADAVFEYGGGMSGEPKTIGDIKTSYSEVFEFVPISYKDTVHQILISNVPELINHGVDVMNVIGGIYYSINDGKISKIYTFEGEGEEKNDSTPVYEIYPKSEYLTTN